MTACMNADPNLTRVTAVRVGCEHRAPCFPANLARGPAQFSGSGGMIGELKAGLPKFPVISLCNLSEIRLLLIACR
jgi:hypothetical protein